MPDQTETQGPTPTQIVAGGERIKLSSGETVLVRQIPCEQWDHAMATALDEGGMLELVCIQDRGWASKVTPADRTLLADALERQNADFFAYLGRRGKLMHQIAPGLIQAAAKSGSR